MIFITGPLYSGKRTFAKTLPGRCICDVQELAAGAENLEKLADELSAYDIVLATEVGGAWYPWTRRTCRTRSRRAAGLSAGRTGRLRCADVLRHPHRSERRTATC